MRDCVVSQVENTCTRLYFVCRSVSKNKVSQSQLKELDKPAGVISDSVSVCCHYSFTVCIFGQKEYEVECEDNRQEQFQHSTRALKYGTSL